MGQCRFFKEDIILTEGWGIDQSRFKEIIEIVQREGRYEYTINYKEVYQTIVECEGGKKYYLIEALAEDVAKTILTKFPVEEIMVRVRKPHVPLHGLVDYVACEITRRRIF